MTNADRISEVYKGEALNAESQRRARERIDWLVAEARGDVLDVGCSQGIASILCARRGLRVVGIDPESDRIEYARGEAARKPSEVRERLEFRVADATRLELADDCFDTVLLGEVLEHLDPPAPALAEVGRVCKPDGIVLMTTPFGVHPHADHSSTYFLHSLVETLAPHLTPVSVEVVDGYFRVVAKPGEMSAEAKLRFIGELQPRLEDWFGEIHEELFRVKARRKRLAHAVRDLTGDLVAVEWRARRVQWALRTARRTRWWRLRKAIVQALRSPRRLALLPRDLAQAVRKAPALPRPSKPERRRGFEVGPKSSQAELTADADRGLKIEIPTVELVERPPSRRHLTVAAILDHFSASALRHEWRQVQFGPDDWHETLERERPQLLFVESAWRGNDGRWRERVVRGGDKARAPLEELVTWCREQQIPTVFWNKEDPPNFGRFVDAAGLFDHVFTVDGDCLPRYAEVLGREDIEVLPFAAAPRIHNPIAVRGGRVHDVAFAGTYFSKKHPLRRKQMETILAPAREFDLHIFSRLIQGEDERFDWPAEYQPHIVGSLPYERMLAAYKAYKVFLNVNSVVGSPTMCARRIFELSACSTPVLSGHSRAIDELFGDLITVARTPEETRAKLTELLADAEARDRLAHRAMREVFAHHTYGHRVDQVLATVGLGSGHEPDAVSVLLAISDPSRLRHALAQVGRQARRPLELVLILGEDVGLDPDSVGAQAAAAGIESPAVVRAGGSPGARLNAALEAATGRFIAVFDEEATYEDHYLTDLVAACAYADAELVGKGADEHSFVDRIHPSTLVAKAELAGGLRFDEAASDPVSAFIDSVRADDGRIYSADRFSFVAAGEDRPVVSASVASGARSGS